MNVEIKNFADVCKANGFVAIPLNGKENVSGTHWKEETTFPDWTWRRADSVGVRMGFCREGCELICIDVDTKQPEIVAIVERAFRDAGIKGEHVYCEQSKKGYHFFLLVKNDKERDVKNLSFSSPKLYKDDPNAEGWLIEMKGGVGYVRTAPSPNCEQFGRVAHVYDLSSPYDLETVNGFVDAIKAQSKHARPERAAVPSTPRPDADRFGLSPFDWFNQNRAAIAECLESIGFTYMGEGALGTRYKRPTRNNDGDASIVLYNTPDGGATGYKIQVYSAHLNTTGAAWSASKFITEEGFMTVIGLTQWLMDRHEYRAYKMNAPIDIGFAEFAQYAPPKPAETVATALPDDFKLNFNFIKEHRVTVADVVKFGETKYKPEMFDDALFQGHALFSDAYEATVASGTPQKHGVFLAAMASASAVVARHIVGYDGQYTVHPSIYAAFASGTGSGKNHCLKFVADVCDRIETNCAFLSYSFRTFGDFDNMVEHNPLALNMNAMRGKVDELFRKAEDEQEVIVNLNLFERASVGTRLPATNQGLITAICMAGRCFYAQDEAGDFFTARGDETAAICSKAKELFSQQEMSFHEGATKGALNSGVVRHVKAPYLNLFLTYAPSNETEKFLRKETGGGFTGRLSMGVGVEKVRDEFNWDFDPALADFRRWEGLGFESTAWIDSALHCYYQYVVDAAVIRTVSATKKKVVYEINPPEAPRNMTVEFSEAARRRIAGLRQWLADRASAGRLPQVYCDILARKGENLSKYALLSMLTRTAVDFGVASRQVELADVDWGFSVLLHEIACLPLTIRSDMANVSESEAGAVIDDRNDELYTTQVVAYVAAHGGATIREVMRARQSSDFPLPPRSRREAIIRRLCDIGRLRVQVNTENYVRPRQELFVSDGE